VPSFVEGPLAPQNSHHRVPLSASLITQALVAVACLMGGYILPLYQPDFRGVTQVLLFTFGGISAVIAVGNMFFGRRISQLLARLGMRSRVVIPREGLVHLGMMLLLAVAGLVGHSNMLLLIFGLMAGPWILNGWFVYMALRGVRVERRARDRVMAGTPVIVDITVVNQKSWITSRLLDIRDEIAATDGTGTHLLGAGIMTIVRLPAGERRTGHYHATFQKRGRYQLGPIRISSRFPLGIGERGQIITNTESILVRPQTGRLRTAWARRQLEQAESSQSQPMRGGVFDDEFHRIREFRAGDNPRSIHWRSTARRGRMMVQEFHQNRESDLFILLDLCAHNGFSEIELELAVSAAATLCAARAHYGSVGLSTLAVAGRTPAFVHDPKGSRFANEAMDVLAECQPADSPSLEPALRQLADAGVLQRCRGVVITSRPEYCHLALAQLCADLLPDTVDVMKRMVVVPATAAALNEMVSFDRISEPSSRTKSPSGNVNHPSSRVLQ
jgi:uncharacterized protein (DUF58 family)